MAILTEYFAWQDEVAAAGKMVIDDATEQRLRESAKVVGECMKDIWMNAPTRRKRDVNLRKPRSAGTCSFYFMRLLLLLLLAQF